LFKGLAVIVVVVAVGMALLVVAFGMAVLIVFGFV